MEGWHFGQNTVTHPQWLSEGLQRSWWRVLGKSDNSHRTNGSLAQMDQHVMEHCAQYLPVLHTCLFQFASRCWREDLLQVNEVTQSPRVTVTEIFSVGLSFPHLFGEGTWENQQSHTSSLTHWCWVLWLGHVWASVISAPLQICCWSPEKTSVLASKWHCSPWYPKMSCQLLHTPFCKWWPRWTSVWRCRYSDKNSQCLVIMWNTDRKTGVANKFKNSNYSGIGTRTVCVCICGGSV